MNNRLVIVFALFIGIFMVSEASAKYGAAGCGLGSMVFKDRTSALHQILAATTNGTAGSQTFGITTGTSNCQLHKKKMAQEVFIKANRVALSSDISRGQGETLSGLAELYECKTSKDFGPTLQRNFETIFPENGSTTEEIHSSITRVVDENGACS